ncbi:MAG: rhodanese-like domain-containing protein [Candidatus Marinimicrobia bacterium]|nr:rhodanese-like domain-containing protein [Candidatus Neomarinimicrobiota bacterium]MCF7850769.1 rhodanese-like domain-containing protein [Candidatus Neomarinimicrobiota bacterium]MCF7904267.1 rhodanese-like domain-containing protein [Candidatus Neomarinimicrobiota bacterium]
MTIRNIVFLGMVFLGVVIAMVPENTTKPYKLTAEEMVIEVQSAAEMVSADNVAHWLISKDPSLQLIDVRSPDEFQKYHLENAINIPLSVILEDEYRDIVDQGVKMNVLYSNGTLDSHKGWMILRQLGFENNYVLQGGLNYWFDTIMNPQAPSVYSADEEFAKYDFRKAASGALGGGGAVTLTAPAKTKAKKPPIIRKKKKKAPEGGC